METVWEYNVWNSHSPSFDSKFITQNFLRTWNFCEIFVVKNWDIHIHIAIVILYIELVLYIEDIEDTELPPLFTPT